MRDQCQDKLNKAGITTIDSALDRRKQAQQIAWNNPFVLSAHRPNYILLLTKNANTNEAPANRQLDWVLPLTRYLHGYVQYFGGYGESIIDYNYNQQSIGIGFALSGWI